jgi:hypothetical protein
VVVETASWSVGIAGLLAALAGILMYLVLTEAITRAVAAADYRSGGHDDHSREARLCVR